MKYPNKNTTNYTQADMWTSCVLTCWTKRTTVVAIDLSTARPLLLHFKYSWPILVSLHGLVWRVETKEWPSITKTTYRLSICQLYLKKMFYIHFFNSGRVRPYSQTLVTLVTDCTFLRNNVQNNIVDVGNIICSLPYQHLYHFKASDLRMLKKINVTNAVAVMHSRNILMAEKQIVCFQSKKVKICSFFLFLTTIRYFEIFVSNDFLVYSGGQLL